MYIEHLRSMSDCFILHISCQNVIVSGRNSLVKCCRFAVGVKWINLLLKKPDHIGLHVVVQNYIYKRWLSAPNNSQFRVRMIDNRTTLQTKT